MLIVLLSVVFEVVGHCLFFTVLCLPVFLNSQDFLISLYNAQTIFTIIYNGLIKLGRATFALIGAMF